MNYHDIYPLVIVSDRYCGSYSGWEFTAWNKYPNEIPEEIDDSDVPCMLFWDSFDGIVGLGNTPDDAIADLIKKINATKKS